jgi:hypothetical protein
MLFKVIITVYTENNMTPVRTKQKVTDCWSRWEKELPLGFKRLNTEQQHLPTKGSYD